jgi:hypothetical protein
MEYQGQRDQLRDAFQLDAEFLMRYKVQKGHRCTGSTGYRRAALQNPEFYGAQAMRLATYNKPRVIACGQ